MKKLSELSPNDYIVVNDIETGLMTKEAFLKIAHLPDFEFATICEAETVVQLFSWSYILEALADDMYDEWAENVYDDIKGIPALRDVERVMNKIFNSHPTYYEGRQLENDMVEHLSQQEVT